MPTKRLHRLLTLRRTTMSSRPPTAMGDNNADKTFVVDFPTNTNMLINRLLVLAFSQYANVFDMSNLSYVMCFASTLVMLLFWINYAYPKIIFVSNSLFVSLNVNIISYFLVTPKMQAPKYSIDTVLVHYYTTTVVQ